MLPCAKLDASAAVKALPTGCLTKWMPSPSSGGPQHHRRRARGWGDRRSLFKRSASIASARQALVALIRRVSHRDFQHAGDGRNPDENRHGASFTHAPRAVGLLRPRSGYNRRDEPGHSTEVGSRAIFVLRNAYLGLGLATAQLGRLSRRHSHRCVSVR